MKKLLLLLVFWGGATEAFAQAELSYDFIQLGYVRETLDDFDCTQDGLAITGNLELFEEVFLVGGLTDVSGDTCGSTTFSGGAGYKINFAQNLSVYSSLSVSSTKVDEGEDDRGLLLAFGGRMFLTQVLEGRAELSHATAYEGTTTFGAGLNYWFDPRFAAVGDVNISSESNSFSLVVRMNF